MFIAPPGRESACGRRTRDPVEFPRTLVHESPLGGETSSLGGALPRIPRRPPHQAREDQPGAEDLVLGRYRLLERLGAGGFGVVWRARDELLHREVAVKRIWLGPHGDSERASREALAAARLAHPAIVALYEACAVEDAFYLISELVHGETLARLIAAGELEDEEVLEIGVALVSALAHAHARGVIHRDIKPQNVLIPHRIEEGAPAPDTFPAAAKLTDFGGASLAGEDALTRTGDVLGTLAYMAPEQSEGAEVGEEADLYALALVLYEALCGINPVRGATPAATVRRIGRPLDPLARRRGDLPRALTDALDDALAPSPRDRGSLERLGGALSDALDRGLTSAPRARSRRPRRVDSATEPYYASHPPRSAIARRDAVPRSLLERPQLPAAEDHAAGEDLATPRRLALPRSIWIGCALVAIGWQAWVGRPGVALLAVAALLPLVALPAVRRSTRVGAGWLGSALAPVLGLAGLAAVFPAIAGQAMRWRDRAVRGALGYWWLVLAEPLLARRLWLGEPAGTPARTVWEGSIEVAAVHVVAPLLTLGVLLGALLWACGSVVLPWLVRGRSATFDVIAATVWSAALITAAPALDSGLSSQVVHPGPRGAALGAVLAGMAAVGARALRGPV